MVAPTRPAAGWWETNLVNDTPQLQITGAPLAIKDKIIVGASGGDRGIRDWIAALNAATGKLLWLKYHPRARRARQRDLDEQCLADRRRRGVVTGSYDPETNQTLWGIESGADDGCLRPARRQPVHQQPDHGSDTGKMNWYFQYTPNDMDYDEAGTHILFEREINGQRRKLITHSGATASSTPWTANGETLCRLHGQHQLDQGHRPEDGCRSTTIQQGRAELFGPALRPQTTDQGRPNRTGGNNRRRTARRPGCCTCRR
jgi:hypothetical protein